MADGGKRHFSVPREADLGLHTIANEAGLAISVLPNGTIFAIEHRASATMINQVLGSPLHGGIGRLYLRIGGDDPVVGEIVGPAAKGRFAGGIGSAEWSGEIGGLSYRVKLGLHPRDTLWFWQIELSGETPDVRCDLVLVQDVGLGSRGFLMGSEAYASQYLDHHIAQHDKFGPVVMSRQNLSQGGRFPWLAQGCLDGAASFATDAIQLLGPDFRMTGHLACPFGSDLPGTRRQHEVGCIALQSRPLAVSPGFPARVTYFGLFAADHPEASGDADLAAVGEVVRLHEHVVIEAFAPETPVRSLLQDAPLLQPLILEEAEIARRFPERKAEERDGGALLSFFVPEGGQNRHVVLAAKEGLVARRHGALLRSGQSMKLDDATLCATAWMHGVFAAQLTIGNTSFHKLFSVSRDPYNITRASGLRILVETGEGWQLLGVPSAFDIGLSDARWIYRLVGQTITVQAIAAGDAPAMQWRVEVEGTPCRFLVCGHVVMGERDYEQTGSIEIDEAAGSITLRPAPDWLWGQTYPNAAYHLVVSTPEAVETVGGDELLYEDGVARGGAFIALRSRPTRELVFAVTGSMTDAAEGAALADRFAAGPDAESLLAPARQFWRHVTRDLRLKGGDRDVEAQDLLLPWLAHDAMMHLTVPHGLEQYTGAAWGTRDVCQGPIELLLALEHDGEVRDILLTLFAEQSRAKGDWPQWFMLDPYPYIRAGDSHGDVIVWPLKALCDYVEATGDIGILDEMAPWRDEKNARTTQADSIAAHIDTLLDTVLGSFIPGTHLIRYGEGDWNDSLQPADPHLRDWMVSSWTVALLYEQVVRYSAILQRIGHGERSASLADLAGRMRDDFNRHLIRDGVVAGYGLFDHAVFSADAVDAGRDDVELLLHPADTRTGLRYSLISMTQAIIGGLFTPGQARHHLDVIREHLLLPDGAHLMDKPVVYRGGPEKLFRRAESAAFFGREIGLMYVHAHLRYCEALAREGDAQALWDGLALVNPIAVTSRLPNASLRQRNTYFSSSDAAFPDRYAASAEWDRVRAGTVAVDGGWRIYSSGPGLYTRAIVELVLGRRRHFGERIERPLMPAALEGITIDIEA